MANLALIDNLDGTYTFERYTEDGESWNLGYASKCTECEGTEYEQSWYEGMFDTRTVRFEDEDDLFEWFNRKPHEEVFFFSGADDYAEFLNSVRR